MGIIAAAKDSISGLLADQWREYFYCDSLPDGVLMRKGTPRNKNNKGNDNIISNGSIIAVNEGQCAIIVDQGAIVDVIAQAGEFVYDTSTEPTLLYGDLGENIKKSFETFGRRFTFGGDTGKDQRVYFFNTKIILNNLFGTKNPVPFRVVDMNIGLDIDTSVKCNGEYSFRLVDPILFYKNIAANVADEYKTQELTDRMRAEIVDALRPAFGKISDMGIRYSQITNHNDEMKQALSDALKGIWLDERGIELHTVKIGDVILSKEDEQMIKDLQKTAVYRSADMRAANLNVATGQAMVDAANNTATGPMFAFAGMNMAGAAGMAANAGNEAAANAMGPAQNHYTVGGGAVAGGAAKAGWKCECGQDDNTGKFCAGCGKPKPSDAGWTCSCGTVNQGKFCQNCGSPKPAGAPMYKCEKSGWEPEDPMNIPKFCPNCGDVFDENDIKK